MASNNFFAGTGSSHSNATSEIVDLYLLIKQRMKDQSDAQLSPVES